MSFYEDTVTAVLVQTDEGEQVLVPIRPLCDALGIDWPAQYRRINRDPVLSDASMSVAVTTTDIDPNSRRPHTSEMLCLPLDYLNGWLFGVNASRVKPEVRERLIRYQRDCYRILAAAFQREAAVSPTMANLAQIRGLALAIAQMAEEQMEHERRIGIVEGRALWCEQLQTHSSKQVCRCFRVPEGMERAGNLATAVTAHAAPSVSTPSQLPKRQPSRLSDG